MNSVLKLQKCRIGRTFNMKTLRRIARFCDERPDLVRAPLLHVGQLTTSVTTGRIHLKFLCVCAVRRLCRISPKMVESCLKLHQNGAKSQYTQPVVTDVVNSDQSAWVPGTENPI